MTPVEMFSFKKLMKHYLARRDGEIRFYPFGVMGHGWVIEESQVPHLERCVGVFAYGSFLVLIPLILLLQRHHQFFDRFYFFAWLAMMPIYAVYWLSTWLFAQRRGHVRRVSTAVLMRDMALNQSAEKLRWRIGACVLMTAASLITILGMIFSSLLGALGALASTLFFGFILLRLLRVQRVQKELGPHADTTAVFD